MRINCVRPLLALVNILGIFLLLIGVSTPTPAYAASTPGCWSGAGTFNGTDITPYPIIPVVNDIIKVTITSAALLPTDSFGLTVGNGTTGINFGPTATTPFSATVTYAGAGLWNQFQIPLANAGMLGEAFTWTISINGGCSTPVNNCPNPDNRLNRVCDDAAQTAAFYCSTDNSTINVWSVANSVGTFATSFSQSDLDKFPGQPGKNTLIKSAAKTQVWRLTTGELELITYANHKYVFTSTSGPVTIAQICAHSASWHKVS